MDSKSDRFSLNGLSDPCNYNDPLDLQGFNADLLLQMLRDMLSIRAVEEIISLNVEQGLIKTPCHLGIGQEAVAVGIAQNLRHSDYVFGTHRSHSHYLAMGGDIYKLIAETFGKVSGASKGMGGSMHLYAGECGFQASVPIVGATIPIAVGAALAAKKDGRQAIAVCFFGDGAAEEGVLHESLNLASIQSLPVLFVCENNLYSSHLDIMSRQPSERVARFAEAHCIDAYSLDGNDVVNLAQTSQQAINHIRTNSKPCFIEAVTYRWKGHVGPDENIDVGVRRSKEELAAWKLRDPIKRLVNAMQKQGFLNDSDYKKIIHEVYAEVEAATDKAKQADYPGTSQLFNLVYSD